MTAQHTPYTPYNAEINRLEDCYDNRNNEHSFTLEAREILNALHHRADGYLLAKAEDDALLEAAKAVWDSVPSCRCREGNACNQEMQHARALNNLRTAITQAKPEGRTA